LTASSPTTGAILIQNELRLLLSFPDYLPPSRFDEEDGFPGLGSGRL
jgi:hypothetical protein